MKIMLVYQNRKLDVILSMAKNAYKTKKQRISSKNGKEYRN